MKIGTLVVTRRKVYAVGALLAAGALIWSAAVDHYWLRGRVVRAGSDEPIPFASIIITVHGDRPYIPIPHSPRTTSVCVRSFIVTADEGGHFKLNRLNAGGPFINKYVTFSTFSEGWMGDVKTERIHSNMLGPPQFYKVTLQLESGERRSYHGSRAYDEQMTRSAAFASLQRFFQPTIACDAGIATPVLIKVVKRMAEIAKSSEERRLTLAYCRRLRESGAVSLACDETIFPTDDGV